MQTTEATADHHAAVGLFHVVYKNQTTGIGGISLTLSLVVSTPTHHANGILHLGAPFSPPLNLTSNVSGNYIEISTLAPPPKIMMLKGYPPVSWPPHGGLGPVIMPNADLIIHFEPDWQAGTATLNYVNANGQWAHVSDVKLVKA